MTTQEPERPPDGPAGPTQQQLDDAVRGTRRSRPKYGVFIGLGVVLGLAAALVLTATTDAQPLRQGQEQFSDTSVIGYTALVLALLGGLLGGGVAVLLDRRR